MQKLKEPISFETTFASYVVDELLGEGGAGRVYGGIGSDGVAVAVKVLASERLSADKRRRFKNEIAFLARNVHPNVVSVIDHGIATGGRITGPFCVMRRYAGNLRHLMARGIAPTDVLTFFSQILDGSEAAHLKGVVHRDLKPENILWDKNANTLAIGDFGIASFTDDVVATLVETAPTQRLANFQYAAPEQRTVGKPVTTTADIYALGLILNEMFTGSVPTGTDYRIIGHVSKDLEFLDPIVARMLKQAPGERPGSIAEVKTFIQKYRSEAVSLQRLSKIQETVIKVGEVDEPLAHEPPKLVDAQWSNERLTLTLDRPVNQAWVHALQNLGNYTSLVGKEPRMFSFNGDKATIGAGEREAQLVINYFKAWLPQSTQVLKRSLEEKARYDEAQRKEALRQKRLAEEQRLRVNRSLQV